ncbi:hypothetical protein ACJX0J_024196, partial [Zea mays]
LRRVGDAHRPGRRRRVAEPRRRDAEAGRVQHGDERQGGGGQRPAVPEHGVLRRHLGPRRQGLRVPERRARLRSGAGQVRRQGVEWWQRRGSSWHVRPRPAQRLLLQPRSLPDRHDRTV